MRPQSNTPTRRTALRLLLCVLLCCAATARATATELWHAEGQKITLSGPYSLALRQSFRWDQKGILYHQEYDFGVQRTLSPSWTLGLNYRDVQVKEKDGDIEKESRPQLIAEWEHGAGEFILTSKNRLEYRNFNNSPDAWRYRNKVTLALRALEHNNLELLPYLSDEIFVDLNDPEFIKNRTYTGLELAISRFTLDLYYMHQSSKSDGDWRGTDVLGSSVKIAF